MEIVMDFNDGGNDERLVLLGMLGIALVVAGKSTLACLAIDLFMCAVVTFLFFLMDLMVTSLFWFSVLNNLNTMHTLDR